jgi:hypothetical protein
MRLSDQEELPTRTVATPWLTGNARKTLTDNAAFVTRWRSCRPNALDPVRLIGQAVTM